MKKSRIYLHTYLFIGLTLSSMSAGAQSTSASTSVTGQSEIKLPEPEEATSKRSVTLISSSYIGAEAANKKEGEVTAYNQLRADYKFTNSAIRVNQLFSNTFGARKAGKSEVTLGDMYLQYSRSNLPTLPGEILPSGYVRAYLPFSDLSQQKGQYVALSSAAILEKKLFDEASLSLNLIPTLYLQSKPSYTADDGSQKSNSAASFWYYLSYGQKLGKRVSLAQDFGLMRYWFKSDPDKKVQGSTKEFLYADTSVSYEFTESFELALGLSSYLARDLYAQKNQFSVYRQDETDYYVAGTVRFQ